jgi:hypothetical protein
LILGLRGLEEAKNLAGKLLRLIQIRSATPSFEKLTPARQAHSPHALIADSSSNKHSQLFIRTHNEPLPVSAMRVSTPDRSPVESIAAPQPQLPPALLRLSAMSSQDFTRRILPFLCFTRQP